MRAPKYKVWIAETDRDITDMVSDFSYEDCVEKDDLLHLTLKRADMAVVDDPDLIIGKVLKYQFGYIGEQVAAVGEVEILDISTTISGAITHTLKCLDKGNVMRKRSSNTNWGKISNDGVAKKLAQVYGLSPSVSLSPVSREEDLVQGNKTDWEFLQQLAQQDGYICYVKGKTLYYGPRDLSKAPIRTYLISEIISFSGKISEVTKNKASGETSATVMDMATKEVKTVVVNDGNIPDDQRLGENTVTNYRSEDGFRLSSENTGQKIVTPVNKVAEAESIAAKKKKDADLEGITASLEVEGDPTLKADELLTLSGFGTIYSGNWYIKSVKHKVGSSYRSTLELSKNGSQRPTRENSSTGNKVNKQTGPEVGKNEKPVSVYRAEDGFKLS